MYCVVWRPLGLPGFINVSISGWASIQFRQILELILIRLETDLPRTAPAAHISSLCGCYVDWYLAALILFKQVGDHFAEAKPYAASAAMIQKWVCGSCQMAMNPCSRPSTLRLSFVLSIRCCSCYSEI